MSVVDTTQVRRRFNPEHGVSYSRAKGRPALDSDFMEVRKRRLKKRVDVRSTHWFPYDPVGVVNADP